VHFYVQDDDLATERVEASRVERPELDVLYRMWELREELPKWYEVTKILVLMQPSSAAAERVFSLLQAFFAAGGRRGHALYDLILSTMQLRYHKRPT
jgi:hypothetical protein